MEHLVILSLVFLNLFMIVGAVDLFYYHMWKYKLHTRPESRYEHKLHMAFAFLMVPVAFLLYYSNAAGYALWAGVTFVVTALLVEMLDVFAEGDSRASLGGLTTGEYSLHVAATIFKVASFVFILGTKPVAAWSLSAEPFQGSYGFMAEMMAVKVMIGSFVMGVVHVALLSRRFTSLACETACSTIGCKRFACCQ